MLLPLFIALLIGVCQYHVPPSGEPSTINGDSFYTLTVALAEWISLTAIAGYAAFQLDAAATKTAYPQHRARPWMPIISTTLFAVIVIVARMAAWVPVEIGALFALPCVLLPPLTYRVTRRHVKTAPPLFSIEETCRVLDSAKTSSLIRDFLARYPDTKVYLYRNPQPHSAGGLLFHNRERLSVPYPTHLEVTLNCPFTARMGVFAESRETFRAYLNRIKSEGNVIHNLPHQDWDSWLAGLTRKEWFERIKELDDIPPDHPNTNGLPCQFQENNWPFEPIDLT